MLKGQFLRNFQTLPSLIKAQVQVKFVHPKKSNFKSFSKAIWNFITNKFSNSIFLLHFSFVFQLQALKENLSLFRLKVSMIKISSLLYLDQNRHPITFFSIRVIYWLGIKHIFLTSRWVWNFIALKVEKIRITSCLRQCSYLLMRKCV